KITRFLFRNPPLK
ncbi:hypothetical protein CP082626L3_1547, partial [Chlamydia psittaci 08-2626_L3]